MCGNVSASNSPSVTVHKRPPGIVLLTDLTPISRVILKEQLTKNEKSVIIFPAPILMEV